MNKQILARDFNKNDYLVDLVLEMNGIDCRKYFCEYPLATGYQTVYLSQKLLQYMFIFLVWI